jgi:hypothetical protein
MFRLQQSHHRGFEVTFTDPFGITETYVGLVDMLKK